MKHSYLMRRFLLLALTAAAALTMLVLPASAAVYRQGDRGSAVTTIQTKLKNWGYYSGSVDGIFGSRTAEAVKYFQRKNSLTADGVVGSATQRALGMSSTDSSSGSNGSGDVYLLAKVISAEARGEPYSGQVAVGAVILNRVEHPSFPNTIAGVVYEQGAFTCMVDGQIDQPIADSAYQAARDALNGADPTGGAIYYFNPDTATSAWILVPPPHHRDWAASVLLLTKFKSFFTERTPKGVLFRCAFAGFRLYYKCSIMRIWRNECGTERTRRGRCGLSGRT